MNSKPCISSLKVTTVHLEAMGVINNDFLASMPEPLKNLEPMLRLIPFQKEKKFCKIQVSICLLEFFIQFPFFYCSFLHYISADNLSFWQATEEEESVSLFSQLKAVHKAGPLTAILPLIYT